MCYSIAYTIQYVVCVCVCMYIYIYIYIYIERERERERGDEIAGEKERKVHFKELSHVCNGVD